MGGNNHQGPNNFRRARDLDVQKQISGFKVDIVEETTYYPQFSARRQDSGTPDHSMTAAQMLRYKPSP